MLIVTGLRALAGVAPSGEWELHRTQAACGKRCDGDGSGVCKSDEARAIREVASRVCFMARDIEKPERDVNF